MIKVIVKKDVLPNDYPTTFVDPAIHKTPRNRDLDRRSDVKPLCVVSFPYVRGVSEKFEKG
jgi:hypothetical protein